MARAGDRSSPLDASAETWEGVARAVHDATGAGAPVSAFELARACGLELVPRLRGGACLLGHELRYDCTVRNTRQHGLVAHEVAHWALRWCGEDDGERAARFTSGALLLPRGDFDRDLRDTAWDVELLRVLHPNVSAEMIARRIVELRDACVTIFDNGKQRARVVSPWLPEAYRLVSGYERELAAACLVSGAAQRHGLCCAFPVFEGDYKRVLVVCEARQLSLRL